MLNLDKIREEHKQKKRFRIETYNKIFNLITKLVELKAKNGETFCLYEVPEFILGELAYDIEECCNYLITELKKIKFQDVSFYAPNIIFLKWTLD